MKSKILDTELAWVCRACGRQADSRSELHDVSCVLNSVLCYKASIVYEPTTNRAVSAEAVEGDELLKIKNELALQEDYEVMDIGEQVLCDICNEDYSHSEEKGGFLFGSKGYCPKCALSGLRTIKKYKEEEYIKAYAEEGESFKDFILRMRGGDNTVRMFNF